MVEPIEFKERGFHNWRNLFKKPTMQDWVILIMLILMIFVAWAYQHDTATCKEFVKQYQKDFAITQSTNFTNINFTLKEDSSGKIGEG